MSKLRIGVVVDNEFTGDLRVENEVILLRQEGYDVTLLCFNFGIKPKEEYFQGAKIVRIKFPKLFQSKLRPFVNTPFDVYSLLWKRFISKFVKKNKIDVLHVHDLYLAVPVLKAKLPKTLKLILDLHENYIEALFSYSWTNSFPLNIILSKEKWEKIEKLALAKFDWIIALSKDFKQDLLKKYEHIKHNKIVVYPNYPNNQKLLNYPIDENILIKNDDFILLYFGVIGKRRGIFTLFEALASLTENYPDIKLLLIGPVDKSDRPLFEKYINLEKLKKNVIHYSWKDIKYLPSYVKISDVCLSPLIKNDQHESGIANKVFQYMLFGKPLIVSNCKPQEELVKSTNCGLVFESENVEELSKRILELYNDPQKRKQMGINGKKAVLEKYNWNFSGQELINLYKTIF